MRTWRNFSQFSSSMKLDENFHTGAQTFAHRKIGVKCWGGRTNYTVEELKTGKSTARESSREVFELTLKRPEAQPSPERLFSSAAKCEEQPDPRLLSVLRCPGRKSFFPNGKNLSTISYLIRGAGP